MKNAKKWAIIGFVCLLLGAIILLATFASAGFDIEKLYSRQLITTLYEFEDDFDKIHISVLTSDVTFARAGDGKTKIEAREIEKIPHTVSVDENTLEITDKDMRKWVDRLNFADAKVSITVYLPKDAYESADVLTRTGDINIVPGFSFGSLQANTSTGKIVGFHLLKEIIYDHRNQRWLLVGRVGNVNVDEARHHFNDLGLV